jgi:hypothetical protein
MALVSFVSIGGKAGRSAHLAPTLLANPFVAF